MTSASHQLRGTGHADAYDIQCHTEIDRDGTQPNDRVSLVNILLAHVQLLEALYSKLGK